MNTVRVHLLTFLRGTVHLADHLIAFTTGSKLKTMNKRALSITERKAIKKAKKAFANHMRKMYPTYTRANWAKTSWRIANPQLL